jgi:hypothetical protein
MPKFAKFQAAKTRRWLVLAMLENTGNLGKRCLPYYLEGLEAMLAALSFRLENH